MREALLLQLALLPDALAGHLRITVLPLGLGVALSLPLALLAHRTPRLRPAVLGAVGIVQTIPGLALLALMVPLLVGLGALLAPAGLTVSPLGLLPAVLALTLYSMLPIVRNTVTGLGEVDPALVEAGRGLGMTPRQLLLRVELPLALPVILAGVRTATVWVVGMATLATPVGQTSLGNYIFSGLQTRNHVAVLFGCACAAGVALVLDGLLGAVERGLAARRRSQWGAAAGVLAVVCAVGLAAPALVRSGGAANAVVIGGKPFTEQYILARALADTLEEAGIAADLRQGLGSTVVFDALVGGEVDAYVDYSGTIWAHVLGHDERIGREETLDRGCEELALRGVTCLGALGFENAYALAVRGTDTEWRTPADLRGADSIGGDYEFFQRSEWAAVRDAYGLGGLEQVTYDPTFLYEALARGEVDAISAYSSDGRIAAFGLEVLADPRGALPPYDAVLLLSAEAAGRPEVVEALSVWIGAVTPERMREANRRVDVDGAPVEEAALWLATPDRAPSTSP